MKADEFIREVDEAVRHERWLTLWNQYGAYLIGAAVAVILGTAVGVGWREYQASERADNARRFAEAAELMRAEEPAAAARAFATLADDTGGGYAVLARLQAADAQARAGDEGARLDILEGIAASDDVDAMYRELSRLLAAQGRLDEAAPEELAERLDAVATSDGPWRHSALELEALAQIRAGETDAARETLSALIDDPAAPANLVQRASELRASLGGPAAGSETAAETSP